VPSSLAFCSGHVSGRSLSIKALPIEGKPKQYNGVDQITKSADVILVSKSLTSSSWQHMPGDTAQHE